MEEVTSAWIDARSPEIELSSAPCYASHERTRPRKAQFRETGDTEEHFV